MELNLNHFHLSRKDFPPVKLKNPASSTVWNMTWWKNPRQLHWHIMLLLQDVGESFSGGYCGSCSTEIQTASSMFPEQQEKPKGKRALTICKITLLKVAWNVELWKLGDSSMKTTLPLHKHREKVCSLSSSSLDLSRRMAISSLPRLYLLVWMQRTNNVNHTCYKSRFCWYCSLKQELH